MNIHYKHKDGVLKKDSRNGDSLVGLPKIGETIKIEDNEYEVFHFDLFKENLIFYIR